MIESKPTPLLQKIFELRKKRKITLTQLGKVMGKVKKGTASAIENGDVPLKAQYLPAIAKLLGVPVWELFVDYEAEEVGPLSDKEKELILNLRKLAKDEDQQRLKKIFKSFSQSLT